MMKDSTRVMRRPRRASPRRARTAAAIIAAAGLALLAAACGGSPSTSSSGSSTAGGPSTSASVVGFSRCMRSHGVPRFPDPVTGDGRLPKISPDILGVSSSQFNAADRSCRHLLPTTGGTSMDSASVEQCIVAGVCLPSVTQRLLNVELRYARCMRSHGVPNWPDPTTNPHGRVNFDVSLAWAASPPEPAHRECARLTGAPIG
jgi:hypothetical protein